MIRDENHIHTIKAPKPQFHRAASHRSSSASHERSADYASEFSSTKSRAGYETPPSRISTPVTIAVNEPEMTLPPRPPGAMLPPLYARQYGNEGSIRMVNEAQSTRNWNNISPPTPGTDDTPYIRFAIEQLTFDEELAGRGRYSTAPNEGFGIPSVARTEGMGVTEPPAPIQSSNSSDRPQPFRFPSSSLERPRRDQVLLPVDTPDQWGSPRYVPIPLRLPMLALLILSCLLMIAGIIFSNVFTLPNHGLYDYDGNFTPRYFVFQYLPQMLGMIIILWLFVVQAAIYRVLPYFSMSVELPHDRVLQNMPILPANFVLPDLRFFGLREPMVGITLLIFWLMNFTIPLFSCLYQTRYYIDVQPNRWRWTSVQGVGYTLVALYIMLILVLLYCIVRFRSKNSALLWDPKSIADVIMLFQRSNVLTDFERTETAEDLRSFIPPRFLRLGYWTPSNSHDIYHTVGQHNGPLNRLSIIADQEKINQIGPNDSFDVERHRYSNSSSFTRNIHSPSIRHRWCPWFLRNGAVLAWIIIAVLLLIAFLVVSFVNRAVELGFYPLLPTATHWNGLSSSNFLYSFIPTLLGMFLFLAWQPIDYFFRSTQAFANLTSPHGTLAKRSLLLSYPAYPLGIVTLKALIGGDFKLAYITFIALLSTTIPVLAGGVFTGQLFPSGDVRMVASMPGYIALCVFVAIYALSFLVIWPTRKRYLPHPVNTVAGQLSFLYASSLLNDPAIRNVTSKKELTSRLSGEGSMNPGQPSMSEKHGLTGDGRRRTRDRRGDSQYFFDRQPKYAFGIYMGRDGKEHLGIDRFHRPGSGEMLVVTGMPRRSMTRSHRSRVSRDELR